VSGRPSRFDFEFGESDLRCKGMRRRSNRPEGSGLAPRNVVGDAAEGGRLSRRALCLISLRPTYRQRLPVHFRDRRSVGGADSVPTYRSPEHLFVVLFPGNIDILFVVDQATRPKRAARLIMGSPMVWMR
jgi:hypothetical protein